MRLRAAAVAELTHLAAGRLGCFGALGEGTRARCMLEYGALFLVALSGLLARRAFRATQALQRLTQERRQAEAPQLRWPFGLQAARHSQSGRRGHSGGSARAERVAAPLFVAAHAT